MKELNEKLAEWAFDKEECDLQHPCEGGHYIADDKIFYGSWGLPNFTESIDASFKWLVPKYVSELGTMPYLFSRWLELIERGVEPAPALCLVLEKLIDEGG